MTWKHGWVALALFAATTGSAAARTPYPPMLNGQKLLDYCNAREQHRRFSCGYYVMGVIDLLFNPEPPAGAADATPAVCPPSGKTPEELVTLVKHYIEGRPAERDKPGYALVVAAMREAFPCK